MIRGLLQVLTLLLILCLCNGNAQTRAAPAPSLSATPSDEKPGVKIQHLSFATEDSGLIYADLYGEGDEGVVLAHGGRFTKESWQPQAQQLARAGFHVLAFDFRGAFNRFSRSASHWPFPLLQFNNRVFARTKSQTHPITNPTRLVLLA
jgi:pimeloyl-ACP methyl ester carboxylesterase